MKIIKGEFDGKPDITYMSDDGYIWDDEESCLDHEKYQSKYEDIMKKTEVNPTIKEFRLDPDFITLCPGIEYGFNNLNINWYKVDNSEDAKMVLKGNLEYSDEALEWTNTLSYPDYIGVTDIGHFGPWYSYKELMGAAQEYMEKYKEYINSIKAQFEKLN